MKNLTWNMLADIIPHTVSVEDFLPSEGTEVDGQRELVEVLDGLLDAHVVRGVVVVVVRGQLRGGQSPHTDDRTAYWTWKRPDQNIFVLSHQLVPQLDQILQSFYVDERWLVGVVEGSLFQIIIV